VGEGRQDVVQQRPDERNLCDGDRVNSKEVSNW
jgi:hypothetical protein